MWNVQKLTFSHACHFCIQEEEYNSKALKLKRRTREMAHQLRKKLTARPDQETLSPRIHKKVEEHWLHEVVI